MITVQNLRVVPSSDMGFPAWRIIEQDAGDPYHAKVICTCHNEQIAQAIYDALRLARHVHEIHDIARKIAGKE